MYLRNKISTWTYLEVIIWRYLRELSTLKVGLIRVIYCKIKKRMFTKFYHKCRVLTHIFE